MIFSKDFQFSMVLLGFPWIFFRNPMVFMSSVFLLVFHLVVLPRFPKTKRKGWRGKPQE